ncbi:MAG TPA: hybrid sensor histidine kinase/response regulator [Verrucomicrobiae bacterium]|jgi:signal transduction histidine kinase|nr:hybrid sensor histidine kinase/response regulator [Verrucomicrobiae bacterium]
MNAPTPSTPGGDILVVDDTREVLQLLASMLQHRGYKVRPALSGELALQTARHAPPDLILLDINMPGLSGFAVAETLKADARLREIPIIFLSALSETLDKVRAFAAGGVDYITKPFQFEEVVARVETHLKIRRLQIELEQRNRELQQSNDQLRRLQELRDNLTHMIIHDLRSPLASLAGYLDLCGAKEKNKLSPEGTSFLARARASSQKSLEMVNSLLDVHKMEAGELKLHRVDCDLVELSREVFALLEPLRQKRQFEVAAAPVRVSADRDLVLRVLQNLIGNAIKFAPDGSPVRIEVAANGGVARLSVSDTGRGIPAEFHERIFQKFGQVKSSGPRIGTGLGLTFCKLAVEAHGGRIGVQSAPGQGSAFWFELPQNPPAPAGT